MKHWKIVKPVGQYAYIHSPSMKLNDRSVFNTFKERKALRQGLDDIERIILEKGFKGWISDTKTSYSHVMRLFAKVNARPYLIKTDRDPTKDTIWFIKTLEV